MKKCLSSDLTNKLEETTNTISYYMIGPMPRKLPWSRLLTRSGYMFVKQEQSYNFQTETDDNFDYFCDIILNNQLGKIQGKLFTPESEIFSEDDWIKIDQQYYGDVKSCSPNELRSLATYMKGFIRWLNKIGVATSYSCDGYLKEPRKPNKRPKVIFGSEIKKGFDNQKQAIDRLANLLKKTDKDPGWVRKLRKLPTIMFMKKVDEKVFRMLFSLSNIALTQASYSGGKFTIKCFDSDYKSSRDISEPVFLLRAAEWLHNNQAQLKIIVDTLTNVQQNMPSFLITE